MWGRGEGASGEETCVSVAGTRGREGRRSDLSLSAADYWGPA